MGENNLAPFGEEQAKVVQQALQMVREGGGYFAELLGDLPKDLVGLLAGERVKVHRAENAVKLWAAAKKRLEDRGVVAPEPPSLKLALPILESAIDENNAELRDLWARLLAAAMDPLRRDAVRQSFIRIVKAMDPLDAIVLQVIREQGAAQWGPSGHEAVVARTKASHDEVRVSFDHMFELGCIGFTDMGHRVNPAMRPLGTLLMNAVSG
jgi:hypothetical protein